jgi:ParB-like chromosome segregation protein Spo0J
MSKSSAAVETATREMTWIEQAMQENPDQILRLDPDDESQLLIITEPYEGHPFGHNTRPTPAVGDKSLAALIQNMEELTDEGSNDFGQLQPCAAVLNENGVADLYFGFQRARAMQTRNQQRRAEGLLPFTLNVIITNRRLSEDELLSRSLAENSFRSDPTPMQVAELIHSLQVQNMGVVEIGKKIGKSAGAVSTYSRFNLLPANAKKLLNSGKMQYTGGENLVAMLPKAAELKTDEDGSVLAAAQAKISKAVDKLVEQGSGSVKSQAAATEARESGAASRQRKVKEILSEIVSQIEKEEAGSLIANRLRAVEKFVNGGSMKALVKALGERASHSFI